MNEAARRQLKWVEAYAATRDAGLTCRRCGISRPTPGMWVRRFRDAGEAALAGNSRHPKCSPLRKVLEVERALIPELRRERNLGTRRIQKVLDAAAVPPLRRPRRFHTPKRFSRPVLGDRVQMVTMKIAPAVNYYTAVDDCSGFWVLGVLSRRSAIQTLSLLERAMEETPFAIARVQTDRSGKFFAEQVHNWLARH
jgi:hypothetical protein